jgi:hypothetical protein
MNIALYINKHCRHLRSNRTHDMKWPENLKKIYFERQIQFDIAIVKLNLALKYKQPRSLMLEDGIAIIVVEG